jgi:hypothetical protein
MPQRRTASSTDRSPPPEPRPREGNRTLLMASVTLLAIWLAFLLCVALRLV